MPNSRKSGTPFCHPLRGRGEPLSLAGHHVHPRGEGPAGIHASHGVVWRHGGHHGRSGTHLWSGEAGVDLGHLLLPLVLQQNGGPPPLLQSSCSSMERGPPAWPAPCWTIIAARCWAIPSCSSWEMPGACRAAPRACRADPRTSSWPAACPCLGAGEAPHLLRAHGFIIVGFAEENPGLDHVSLQPVDPLWA